MDATISFYMDSEGKAKVEAVCEEPGMTPSAADAKAWLPKEKMLEDAALLLDEFAEDYKRMAE